MLRVVTRQSVWAAVALTSMLIASCSNRTEVLVRVMLAAGIDASSATSLAVDVTTDLETMSQSFLLNGELNDGETSFTIRPGDFEGTMAIEVSLQGPGAAIASGSAGMIDVVPGAVTTVDILLECVFPACGGGADAGTDVAPGDAGPCTPVFGTPVNMDSINTTSDELFASVSGDLLSFYFDSGRVGGPGPIDIWLAARADIGDPFTNPMALSINTSMDDLNPDVSTDGLMLIWAVGEADGSGPPLNLFWADRSSEGSPFGNVIELIEVNSSSDESHPNIAGDGRVIFFTSDRSGGSGGSGDIWMASRSSTSDPFDPPVEVVELNTGGYDGDPWVSDDLLNIYFVSSRSGGVGSTDIWRARRTSPMTPWGQLENVTEINSADADRGPTLSPDGTVIYFSTSNGNDMDLYEATRSCGF